MNRTPLLFAALLLGPVSSCTDNSTENVATRSPLAAAPPVVSSTPAPPPAAAFTTYRYENDTLQQTARLRKQGKGVAFEIVSRNKRTDQSFSFTGEAARQPAKPNPERDSDESGASYPVDEYRFGGDCHLAIRVEMKGETRLQINEGNCETFQKRHDAFTPFASVGVLKKQR